MPIVKWRDAYTSTKTSLEEVKKELGKVGICKTHGKMVYRNKTYTIIEQHSVSECKSGDYFTGGYRLVSGTNVTIEVDNLTDIYAVTQVTGNTIDFIAEIR